MVPRSSMVTSRLTSTRRRASWRDPVDRLTPTIAGSSWGVMPMAIARENSSGRCRARLMTKIAVVSTPATHTSSVEKPRSPAWNAVSVWRSASPTAILPNAVAAGGHHHPTRGALVDHGAHERARGQVDGGVARGDRGSGLGRRDRLAGQDGLVALQLVGLQQPQVAGHQVAHVQALLAAVAPDQRLVADACVQRRDRQLGAVLVDKAQAHAQRHDRGDDGPVGGVAGGRRDARRGQQQEQQRVAELAAQDPKGGHRVGGQHVTADTGQPGGGLLGGEAGLGAAQLPQYHTGRLAGSGRKVQRRPLGPCRRQRRGGLAHSLLLLTRRPQRSSCHPALTTAACQPMDSQRAASASSSSSITTASTIAIASSRCGHRNGAGPKRSCRAVIRRARASRARSGPGRRSTARSLPPPPRSPLRGTAGGWSPGRAGGGGWPAPPGSRARWG
jgi:hypothetical protein